MFQISLPCLETCWYYAHFTHFQCIKTFLCKVVSLGLLSLVLRGMNRLIVTTPPKTIAGRLGCVTSFNVNADIALSKAWNECVNKNTKSYDSDISVFSK